MSDWPRGSGKSPVTPAGAKPAVLNNQGRKEPICGAPWKPARSPLFTDYSVVSDWAKLYPNLSHYISSYQIEENPLILHQILRVALDCTNLYCVVPSWTKLFQVLPDRIRFDQFPQVCADFFTLASDGSRFCWIAPECARLYQIARSAPTSFKVYLCQLVPDCIKSYQILPSCTKATNCIIIFVIVSEIYLNL